MKKTLIGIVALGLAVISVPLSSWQGIDILSLDASHYFTGSTMTIHWMSSGCPRTADINLIKNGKVFTQIAGHVRNSSDMNENYFTWKIPLGLPSGTYRVEVKALSIAPTVACSDRSENISIERSWLRVVSPNGGETWQCGQKYSVLWQGGGGPFGHIKVELLKGLGVVSSSIHTGYIHKADITLPGNLTSATNYRVRISWTEAAMFNDKSDGTITISCPGS